MHNDIHQVLSCLIQNNTNLDYFDIKSIALSSKEIYDTVKDKVNVRSCYKEHIIYVMLYNFIVYNLPNSQKCNTDVMGVKFVFKGRKQYLYNRDHSLFITNDTIDNMQIIGTDNETLFSIGSAYKSGKQKIYFGNTPDYTCIDIHDIHKHRESIKNFIYNILPNIREFDIYVYNTKHTIFHNFIIRLITLLQDTYNVHTIHLYNENFLENILLYSS